MDYIGNFVVNGGKSVYMECLDNIPNIHNPVFAYVVGNWMRYFKTAMSVYFRKGHIE